ncbi:MAG: hypothetical protein C1O27_000259 [Chloroflexi bacterium]|jgi:hypothetical protein|nr:MAG: hypothetical protein C1O27_000259 [Chloroflexota bacterium]
MAHGFGERYDLPVPLGLYLAGAGAAVALSFVAIGVFVKAEASHGDYPRFNLLRWRLVGLIAGPWFSVSLRVASVALLVLVIATGLYGDRSPTLNLAPTFVWVIWWVGLAYVSALVGNLWAILNPWKAIFEGVEVVAGWLTGSRRLSLDVSYPASWGVWPGVALFIVFAWIELVFPDSARPSNIAKLALAYSAITWTGMLVFGKDRWLRSGEAFSLVFGLLSRFSPTEVRMTDPKVCKKCPADCLDAEGRCVNCYHCFHEASSPQRELNLRPYGVGLLSSRPVTPSMMVLVVALLATVSFDGVLATSTWASIQNSLFNAFPSFDGHRLTVVDTAGLVGFGAIILAVFGAFSWLMSLAGGKEHTTGVIARYFVLSLLPIALGYHLAHFLTFLLIQGQPIIPLASDPFGRGWDIFGTTDFKTNISIVGARFAWFLAVIAIVIGHVIAVYLAHVVALRAFSERKHALRSQYPMLALMVGYTVLSLWILAQPIVAE